MIYVIMSHTKMSLGRMSFVNSLESVLKKVSPKKIIVVPIETIKQELPKKIWSFIIVLKDKVHWKDKPIVFNNQNN